ncbi:hypothetical protein ACT048_04645 [Ectopseudomonas khazarica]|uniref:hypothetical protein n=1 Tax=Ectopseudomonas khazarica TaxID=2502979 RepID=UPI00403352C5
MTNLTQFINGGMLLKQQLVTVSGNWPRPANLAGSIVYVTLIGGGASGRGTTNSANSAIGGNGGQYRIRIPVDIGAASSVLCTIGEGGADAGPGVQNPGGVTSFGAFLSVLGGSTDVGPGSGTGGAPGGRYSTSTIQGIQGADTPLGYGGRAVSSAVNAYAAGGGGLNLGIDPPRSGFVMNQITASQGYGAGGYGQGGSGTLGAGYAGVQGAILIEWPEVV